MGRKPTLNEPSPLTAAIISHMSSGEELADSLCRGLRVRCLATGLKVFFHRYRGKDGALRQIRLGTFGALTLAKAREAVAKRRAERDEGRDPQLEKRKGRDQAKRERAAHKQATYTVTDLVEEYISEALAPQKRGREAERLLRKDFLPVFGARAAIDVSRRELLTDLIRPKMLRYPRTATQLLSRIRCAYAHAIEQGRVPEDFSSPTVGIRGASQVRRRSHPGLDRPKRMA